MTSDGDKVMRVISFISKRKGVTRKYGLIIYGDKKVINRQYRGRNTQMDATGVPGFVEQR